MTTGAITVSSTDIRTNTTPEMVTSTAVNIVDWLLGVGIDDCTGDEVTIVRAKFEQ